MKNRKTECPKGHPYSGSNRCINKSGYQYCKKCSNESVRKWLDSGGKQLKKMTTEESREKARQYVKKYREKYKDRIIKSVSSWNLRNRLKRLAHSTVWNAINAGQLVQGVCQVCGNEKVDAHHTDYSKPLEVMWLCRLHHKEWHRDNEVITN